jgi:hypothetical protein
MSDARIGPEGALVVANYNTSSRRTSLSSHRFSEGLPKLHAALFEMSSLTGARPLWIGRLPLAALRSPWLPAPAALWALW